MQPLYELKSTNRFDARLLLLYTKNIFLRVKEKYKQMYRRPYQMWVKECDIARTIPQNNNKNRCKSRTVGFIINGPILNWLHV